MDVVTLALAKKYIDTHGGGAGLDIKIVEQLPTTGKALTIYFIHNQDKEAPNYYDEWMWIQNAWEIIGTTQVNLTDYVKNTDYATNSKGGVIKIDGTYDLELTDGTIRGMVRTKEQYVSKRNNALISKGTLENIKSTYVKEGMAANMLYDEETETLTITTE